MTDTTRILLAEDEEIIAIIISELLSEHGFSVTVCTDGAEAWDRLNTSDLNFDAIILDRVMPRVDGMELLRRIKADPTLTHTPVIMETAQSDLESIREGLAQGAYYYLTKPFQPEVLLAVVQSAVDHMKEYRGLLHDLQRAESTISFLTRGEFRFRGLDEARSLANYLALACPEPARAIQGFQELLVNAVEHGNLGITYAEKSELLMEGAWHEEVSRRLARPEFSDMHVEVLFERLPDRLVFTIRDQGKGFDWESYLDFAPERAFDLHGRGIAMARKLSFDQLMYQGNGNTVMASVILESAGAQSSQE